MDKYFEALEKSKNQVTLGVLGQVGFDETAEVLEKGKKAAMGEIRDWNGVKYQKTPKGWAPVKKQEGASKGKLELPETGKELIYECKDESGPSLIKVRALNDGKYGFKKMVSGKWVGDGVGTAEQAQKKLSNYTLDKEKNTPPAEKKSTSEYEGEEGFNKLCDQIRLEAKAVYCQFTGDLKNPEASKETGSTDKGIVNRVRLLKFRPNEEKGLFKKVEVTVQYQGDMSIESVTLSVPQAEKLVASISKVDDLPKRKSLVRVTK